MNLLTFLLRQPSFYELQSHNFIFKESDLWLLSSEKILNLARTIAVNETIESQTKLTSQNFNEIFFFLCLIEWNLRSWIFYFRKLFLHFANFNFNFNLHQARPRSQIMMCRRNKPLASGLTEKPSLYPTTKKGPEIQLVNCLTYVCLFVF